MHVAQVEAALRMHTSDNVSVVMVCFGPDAPPRRCVHAPFRVLYFAEHV